MLSFEQALLVGFLGGAGAGILVTYLTNLLQVREAKKKKQQQLYGRILGLKDTIADVCLYKEVARINLYYYSFWKRLSWDEAARVSEQEEKTWQSNIKETEISRSEKFAELFETLGLIWSIFPKDSKLNSLILPCFAIQPIHAKYPEKKEIQEWQKNDIQNWRNEKEIQVREEVKKNVVEPLDLLINYLHNKVVGTTTTPDK